MATKTKNHVSTEPKNPTDDHIVLLREVAEAAGDDELVKLCGLALEDYATSRWTMDQEILDGPRAEAFKEALAAKS